MKKVTLFFALFSTILLSNCESSSDEATPAILNDITLKSGESFGFCIGKCYKEITIKGDAVELLVIERVGRTGVAHKDPIETKYTDKLSASDLQAIEKEINLSKFTALNEVYGCPDCADGGAEWIEVLQKGDIKDKVTYEFGKDVAGIEGLTKILRTKREEMIKKYVKNE